MVCKLHKNYAGFLFLNVIIYSFSPKHVVMISRKIYTKQIHFTIQNAK